MSRDVRIYLADVAERSRVRGLDFAVVWDVAVNEVPLLSTAARALLTQADES